MKNKLHVLCVLVTALYLQTAVATTDYLVTGTFSTDQLEVHDDYDQFGNPILIDAFVFPEPLDVGANLPFTLSFSVDETANGSVPPIGGSIVTVFFNGAVSNISLDIDGVNVLSDTSTDTIQQSNGGLSSEGFVPARWSWDLFPGADAIDLDSTMVFDFQNPPALINTIVPSGLFFGLFDSTQEVYGGPTTFPNQLISLELGDFDDAALELFWTIDDSEQSGDPDGFDGIVDYRVIGEIESVTNLSAIPIPAAAWFFISALGAMGIVGRRST